MPERLFKYQPFNMQVLRNLKDRTLWFSSRNKLNDPFDCALSVFNTDPSDADFLRLFEHACVETGQREQLTRRFIKDGRLTDEFRSQSLAGIAEAQRVAQLNERGIASFGQDAHNLLMWGHYADGHRGLCLEFDGTVEPFSKSRKVQYRSEFPALNPVHTLLPVDEVSDPIAAFLLTKAECWKYEEEWRVLHTQSDHAYTYPWSALKAVHLGALMPEVDVEIIALVLAGSPTKFFKTDRSATSFAVGSREVVYEPFKFLEQ